MMAQPRVAVTAAAEKFMRRMVRFSEHPGGGFRLRVAPGGCSGLQAEFSVEATRPEGDAEIAVNGLRVFLPAQSRLLLDGVTVDFTDSPLQSGFTFVDPKAAACGCASAGEGAEAGHSAAPAEAAVALSTIRRL